VLAAGAAAAAAQGRGSDSGEPADRGSATPPATSKITRQTLVDSESESGSLGYGDAVTVTGKLPGTLTALPAPDAVVRRGQALFRVDDTPVVLLYGTLPAYRVLATGVKGADVEQFERNLAALGFTGFTVDKVFSASTATAVKKWQKRLGLPQTGRVELGRVHYAAGAVRIDAAIAAIGDGAATGVLSYTGSDRLVTVELPVSGRRLARKGAAVTVRLPDGRTAPGTIVAVRTVIRPAEGNNPAQTKIKVQVAMAAAKTLAGLDQATVDVAFEAGKRDGVLTVPVAALLALAEGGYGVQVVDGGTTRVVAVETGLFAGGRVEVSGEGLAEGMTVGVPS
ncbi:MAG: efflux RND transporter periplasmic adaptor subunit, partial [Hamadaea sp.]|nr:efflux RND transporter periplasmic adaptor subunit [Hamadaea sp.]